MAIWVLGEWVRTRISAGPIPGTVTFAARSKFNEVSVECKSEALLKFIRRNHRTRSRVFISNFMKLDPGNGAILPANLNPAKKAEALSAVS